MLTYGCVLKSVKSRKIRFIYAKWCRCYSDVRVCRLYAIFDVFQSVSLTCNPLLSQCYLCLLPLSDCTGFWNSSCRAFCFAQTKFFSRYGSVLFGAVVERVNCLRQCSIFDMRTMNMQEFPIFSPDFYAPQPGLSCFCKHMLNEYISQYILTYGYHYCNVQMCLISLCMKTAPLLRGAVGLGLWGCGCANRVFLNTVWLCHVFPL